MNFSTLRALAHGAIALTLAACGGGGDGGIGGTGGGGGGLGTDVSVGTITAFGSVWVNGVRFDDSQATITIDDNSKARSDLRVGMVARLNGSISGATASTINVTSAVKGYVESANGNQLVVMGQNVTVDPGAISNGPIAAGHYVEVHGQVVSDGTIQANFAERKTTQATPPFVVKGFVKGHTAGGTTFQVGALNVTLANGATINDMPGGSWNGILAEVKGSTCAGNPPTTNVCGTLTATKVEPEGVRGDVSKIEVEGFVTALTSTSDFTVGSQHVVTNGSTAFQGGLQSEIVLTTKLEVEGSLSGGILTATKVSFRENIRFEANLASKGATSFTLAGLPGITIETNALTQFKNTSFAALAVGNNLRVRGRPGSGNTVIASEVEDRGNGDTDVRFQAVASAVAAPNITMLGIVVDTSPISNNNFKDINDAIIGRSAFFAAAAPGKLIKVRGTLSGGTISWNQEIEFED